MKTLTKYALACTVAFSAVYGGAKIYDYQKPHDYAELMNSVVKVQGKNGHGSGVLIAPDLILTNRHVADAKGDKTVKFKDGTELDVKIIALGEGSDWAVLRMSGSVEHKPANIDCRIPEFGEHVISMGNPVVIEFAMSKGNMSHVFDKMGDRVIYVMDATITRGSSGGPVFDVDGDLIGLNTVEFYTPIGMMATKNGFSGMTSIHDFCSIYE